jgi:hypothetical protein
MLTDEQKAQLSSETPCYETLYLRSIVACNRRDGKPGSYVSLELSDGSTVRHSLNGGALAVVKDKLEQAGIALADFGKDLSGRGIPIRVAHTLDEDTARPLTEWVSPRPVNDETVAATIFAA